MEFNYDSLVLIKYEYLDGLLYSLNPPILIETYLRNILIYNSTIIVVRFDLIWGVLIHELPIWIS